MSPARSVPFSVGIFLDYRLEIYFSIRAGTSCLRGYFVHTVRPDILVCLDPLAAVRIASSLSSHTCHPILVRPPPSCPLATLYFPQSFGWLVFNCGYLFMVQGRSPEAVFFFHTTLTGPLYRLSALLADSLPLFALHASSLFFSPLQQRGSSIISDQHSNRQASYPSLPLLPRDLSVSAPSPLASRRRLVPVSSPHTDAMTALAVHSPQRSRKKASVFFFSRYLFFLVILPLLPLDRSILPRVPSRCSKLSRFVYVVFFVGPFLCPWRYPVRVHSFLCAVFLVTLLSETDAPHGPKLACTV